MDDYYAWYFLYRHKYELLHFKITQDQNTREICVASKKFPNFHELLEFYKYNPLKIRSRPNDNILLTFPLPVDKYLENIHKQAQDELYSELAGECVNNFRCASNYYYVHLYPCRGTAITRRVDRTF